MDGDTYGNGYHKAFETNRVEDISTVEERCPQHGEDIHLDTARDNLMFTKFTDIRAQFRMVHQPGIQA